MKLVALGFQGLRVPALGLGCMGMSEFYGSSSEAQNLRVLHRAVEMGCTFWDTSDMYGPFTNELLLGKAVAGRRDRITLATKFGVSRAQDGGWHGIKGGADYVKACCDASLKRLGVDYIDLYYQHRVDPNTPIEETVGAMAELVKAGKVRYLGLSKADAKTIERAHATFPISALQTEYSLWSRDVESRSTSCRRCEGSTLDSSPTLPLGEDSWRAPFARAPICNRETGGSRTRVSPMKRSPRTAGWRIWLARSPRSSTPRRLKWRWPGFCRARCRSPRSQGRGESSAWRKTGRHRK